MTTQFTALPLASAAPVQIEDPDHEEDLIEEDDDDRELTVDDFGDDEDPGRVARYHRWLSDDGSMDVYERNSW